MMTIATGDRETGRTQRESDCQRSFCFADHSSQCHGNCSCCMQDISSVRPQSPEEALWFWACVYDMLASIETIMYYVSAALFSSTVHDVPETSHLEAPFS